MCRGDTALHKAASEKLHAVCRLLVEAGASLKKTNFQVFAVNDVTHTLCPKKSELTCDISLVILGLLPWACPWFLRINLFRPACMSRKSLTESQAQTKNWFSQKWDFSVNSQINVLEFWVPGLNSQKTKTRFNKAENFRIKVNIPVLKSTKWVKCLNSPHRVWLQQGKTAADQAGGDVELTTYLSGQRQTSSNNREDLETAVWGPHAHTDTHISGLVEEMNVRE